MTDAGGGDMNGTSSSTTNGCWLPTRRDGRRIFSLWGHPLLVGKVVKLNFIHKLNFALSLFNLNPLKDNQIN